MLSDEERAAIGAAVPPDGEPRTAVVDALTIVQRRRGWVSDEDVADVAEALGMSAADVDDTASFYSLIYRRPVGRHVILVCDSVVCWLTGHEDVLAHLTGRLGIGLGETTADGTFTLLPVACLGLCEEAPAVLVDDEPHTRLDGRRVDEILARYGWAPGQAEAALGGEGGE